MGKGRTLAKVAKQLGKKTTTVCDMSADHHWQDRIAAWEREQDRVAQQAQLNAIKKMRREHADLGYSMLIKAAKALKRLPDDDLKAVDISRMVEVGSKLERIARGDVGEVIEEREGEAMPPLVTFYMPSNQRGDEAE